MKKKYIIGLLVAILVIGLGIGLYFFLNKDNKTKDSGDAKKFASEYTKVGNDNVFVYRNAKEIIAILEKGTGVVYLGFPECPWCQIYVTHLNDAAKNLGIEKIYYFNIAEDRKNNTEDYQKIVSLIKNQLQFDDEGKERIYVPHVSIVKKGVAVGYDYETSLDTKGFSDPTLYWAEDRVSALKLKLHNYMKEVLNEDCKPCEV